MAKQKVPKTESKNYKTEDVEEILKRKELQNKMFEKIITEIASAKNNKIQNR